MLVKATAVAAAVLAVGASACGGDSTTSVQGELAELAGDSSGALALDVIRSTSPLTGFSLGADQIKIGTEAVSLKCATKTVVEDGDVRMVDLSCSFDAKEGRLGATLAIPAVMTLSDAPRHQGKKGTEMNFTAFDGEAPILEVSLIIAPIDCVTSYAVNDLIFESEKTTPIPNPMRRSDSKDDEKSPESPEDDDSEDDGETDVSKHHKKGKHHKGKHHKGKHHKGKHHKGKHHKGKHHKDDEKDHDDETVCMVTDIHVRSKYLVIVDPINPGHHEEEPEYPEPHRIDGGDDDHGDDDYDDDDDDEKRRHRRPHPLAGLALIVGVFLAGVFVGRRKERKAAAAASSTAAPVILVAPPRYTSLPAEPVEKV